MRGEWVPPSERPRSGIGPGGDQQVGLVLIPQPRLPQRRQLWPSSARAARVGEPGVALLWRARPTEVNMTSTGASSETWTETPEVGTVDMKLEVVTVPVSDVERAKRFYQSMGWRLDVDLVLSEDIRLVQMTPPHSPCSIHFGKG